MVLEKGVMSTEPPADLEEWITEAIRAVMETEIESSDGSTVSYVWAEDAERIVREAVERVSVLPRTESPEPIDGAGLISAERARQVDVEGWTPEHDAGHRESELARAAYCYVGVSIFGPHVFPVLWPWHWSWWKPSDDPIRNLVKGGALIAAEIDRIRAVVPVSGGGEQ